MWTATVAATIHDSGPAAGIRGGHLSLISDPSDTAKLIVRAANATS
jgi:hypothetical protein